MALSPECVRCCFKSTPFENALGHWGQENGFSSECVPSVTSGYVFKRKF